MFFEKWTHFKIALTDTEKIDFEFAYIPEDDSQVSLHMSGISDLSEEEWAKITLKSLKNYGKRGVSGSMKKNKL